MRNITKQLTKKLENTNKKTIGIKKNVARYLAQKEAEVETTSEAKGILPIIYKKWAKRLRI